MLHTKFRKNQPAGSGEDFCVFYHIWAWRPSWSCDQDIVNKRIGDYMACIRLDTLAAQNTVIKLLMLILSVENNT